MAKVASSYMRTNGAAVTRNHDALRWANVMGRPCAMTIYIRFVELGAVGSATTFTRLLHIGDDSGTNPAYDIDNNNTNRYAVRYRRVSSGTANAVVAVAQPTVGDIVELNATLNNSGDVTLQQSINGTDATVVTSGGSGNQTLALAWSAPALRVNGLSATSQIGFVGIRDVVIVRGVQTLATMRRLAGTAAR